MSASGEPEVVLARPVAAAESPRAVLRVRRIHDGKGPGADLLLVSCPSSRLLVAVDECVGCEHAEMLSVDSDGYGSFVICCWPRGARPPPRGCGDPK